MYFSCFPVLGGIFLWNFKNLTALIVILKNKEIEKRPWFIESCEVLKKPPFSTVWFIYDIA